MSRLRKVLDPTRTGKDAESLERTLLKLVVGQDEAVEQIVNIYQMNLTGLSAPGRPVGNFLFLGPTGSGKTRTVEATAEALLHNPRAVIKIDCAEFQHSHEIAKLIGSPPGYLGHRETHPLLSQEVINQHHTESVKLSFILFDEIEKASDALWNLLLGILDKATLTLGDNRKVDFSRAMIFMTSNLGANEMNALINPKLGFQTALPSPQASCSDEQLNKKISRTGIEAARRKFTPEFMNRIDKVVVFKPLGEPELRRILDLELREVQQRTLFCTAGKTFAFTVSDSGKNLLLAQGTDLKYGARHLKRAIERLVVHPISNLLATNQINTGDWIQADVNPKADCLVFTKEAEGLEPQTIAGMIGENFRVPPLVAAAYVQSDATKVVAAKPAKR
ncbi:MAG: ATP-dependent Clp protease ATP-binding subunit [Acidobacteriaceae bacterium]|nr:ATP-dependent Clp protease ATP-binding subunit [Acidobacteriaceae bacterium]MBV9294645.1 ATP-dependent Clp protease ATP-binding subunit [Acidobacteriaceae bacterium]MBV9766902.1 ATP-dependent Clp protease ATP-binding subunit [Acidobacteriaceae bacterium]